MAGQIIMTGYLGDSFKIKPWIRRLITRSMAIVPALIIAVVKGEQGINDLLVLSQVVLSMQLPFVMWPLVYFTSTNRFMLKRGEEDDQQVEEDFKNGIVLTVIAVIVATIITGLNIVLLVQLFSGN